MTGLKTIAKVGFLDSTASTARKLGSHIVKLTPGGISQHDFRGEMARRGLCSKVLPDGRIILSVPKTAI